jgi:hypothetical protein
MLLGSGAKSDMISALFCTPSCTILHPPGANFAPLIFGREYTVVPFLPSPIRRSSSPNISSSLKAYWTSRSLRRDSRAMVLTDGHAPEPSAFA